MTISPEKKEAYEIIALLGWDYYDGCNEIDKAGKETLCECLKILEAPDTQDTPEWIIRRSKAAAEYIRQVLEERS